MKKVEFMSYNGHYPHLCMGVLTLKLDGETVELYSPLESCGRAFVAENGDEVVEKGQWKINPAFVPAEFREYIPEIENVVNNNVPHGCCGGCI